MHQEKTPVEIDALNNLDIENVMQIDVYLSIFGEIPSRPVDLVVFISINNSSTDFSVQRKSLGQLLGCKETWTSG